MNNHDCSIQDFCVGAIARALFMLGIILIIKG